MFNGMKLGKLAAVALPLIIMSTLPATAKTGVVQTTFEPDDGTYKVVPISSPDQCSALCKADPKCRGAVTYQPDVRKPEAVCRLNDGFGSNPVFPQVAPQPLNLSRAVGDLNAYRASHGLKPVTIEPKLIEASRIHADDLSKAGIISHNGTDGSTHGDRAHRVGYNFLIAGENVATGQKSWDQVFEAWKKSPGHNENLLRPDVSEFGIALVYEPRTTYSTYWAMLVAEPLDTGPLGSRDLH
ncbi:CAP domain-containing protein [uncultured Algimonas sp.]|uniref:CAP domain-containing protein n=1 Tax=uncultured Algimonas sp. TaxID=1547920 RepID=UPI002604D80E|nr:CAP domain-containing protein [uncultured Algimonas sp.]